MAAAFSKFYSRLLALFSQWEEADQACLSSLSSLAGISERLAVLLPPGADDTYEYFRDASNTTPALAPFTDLSKVLVRSHMKSFDKILMKLLQLM
jgi:hypothetical protein